MPSRFRPRIEILEDRRLLATITDLGTLGGTDAQATAINSLGQATGTSPTAAGDLHPFLYSSGQMTDLGALASYDSFGLGLNNAGQVVGYGLTTELKYHAFLAADGTVTDLGTFGGTNSAAHGINDNGQVVGFAATDRQFAHAFLYADGVLNDLGTLGGDSSAAFGINSAGQVAGWSDTAGPYPQAIHAFLYSDGQMTDLGTLPGGTDSYATAINDNGDVAGSAAFDAPLARHAFLYSGGQMTDLGTLPDYSYGSFATALNNLGQVVGYAITENFASQHAFFHKDGQMIDLNQFVPPGQGWELTSATGINDQGQIVGSGIHDGSFRAYLLDLNGSASLPRHADASVATALPSTRVPAIPEAPVSARETPILRVQFALSPAPQSAAAGETTAHALPVGRSSPLNPTAPDESPDADLPIRLIRL